MSALTVPERERKFASAWRPIALRGTPLDAAQVRKLSAEHAEKQESARLRVLAATDGMITNPKSGPEVTNCLTALGYELPRTKPTRSKPQGGPSAAKGVLEPLAASVVSAREQFAKGNIARDALDAAEASGDPLCADILEYRQHDTARGLLLNPWQHLIDHGDGRLRSNIMSIEARTGRTSSRDFNMQQVSRRGGMRACATTEVTEQMVAWGIAPESALTCGISADFNAVEVRCGAALSGDQAMQYLIAQLDAAKDAAKAGIAQCATEEQREEWRKWLKAQEREFDFHWRTAITCYGAVATKENRYNAKRINFAKMFGSGKTSCAALVGVPVKEVSQAFDAFSSVAPQYEEWDRQMRKYVENGGRTYELYSGRRAFMDPEAYWGAGNTAIQGSARELAVDATLKWLDGPWGAVTTPLIVHDELIVWNIPRQDAADATQYLVQCMETEILGVQIRAEAADPWESWPDAS